MTLNHTCHYPVSAALMLAFLLAFPVGALQAGEIYRHVDEDGNVTYSDEPREQDSKPMELTPLPEMNIPTSENSSRRSEEEQAASKDEQERELYDTVEISEPEHDSAFWRGGGKVTVRIHSQPKLSEGHSYQLEFDGETIEETRSTSITLDNVDRGTHEIVVHILDSTGEVITSSDLTRFTLHRPSQQN